jgi:hypothetical protein
MKFYFNYNTELRHILQFPTVLCEHREGLVPLFF